MKRSRFAEKIERICPTATCFWQRRIIGAAGACFYVNFVTSRINFSAATDTVRGDASVRTLPFLLFIGVLALRGALPAGEPGEAGGDLRWLYGLQAAVACTALFLLRSHYRELARPRFSPGQLLLSLLGGSAVFVLWISPMPGWAHLGSPVASFVPLDATGALQWGLIAVRSCGAVLVVPVMEELFWRSFLMRWIDKRNFLDLAPHAASATAMLVSSAIFALAHELWLCAFCAGLVYAQIYRRTGNIWCAVLAHSVTNLLLAIWVVGQSAWTYW